MEQRGGQQPGDGAGIVQRGTGKSPLGIPVVDHEEVKQFRHAPGHRIGDGAHPRDVFVHHLGLVGHVQPAHGDGDSRLEHHIGRLGIHINIEFRRRGPVARSCRAPHQHDAGDPGLELGMGRQQQGDVGERTGRHQSDRLRALTQALGHQFEARHHLGRKGGIR